MGHPDWGRLTNNFDPRIEVYQEFILGIIICLLENSKIAHPTCN